ncbi:MAG: hypothetical protein CL480_11360 [Acidobacteria bacterium]|nr:hypothetical protein [Acidobacteriota bacterium]|tara:strand:- start:7102 stop:7641 length:540 start_codon:yes stop_codon:yes gene_type:complete
MAAFADSADMLARYDARTLGDLLADDGTRVTTGNMAANTRLSAALKSATGRLKAAVLRAERYTVDDIANMQSSGHANYDEESSEYLKTLTCDVAFWEIWKAKPHRGNHASDRKEAREASDLAIAAMTSGAEVFNVPRITDAGTPKVATVTRAEIESEWMLAVDQARGRFYPRRRSYRSG